MVSGFLKNQGMHPDCIDFDAELRGFLAEMECGLKREGESSLAMLPTYLSGARVPKNGRRVLALDVGGTNIRAALAKIENGGAVFEDVRRTRVPERVMEKDEFFDELAEHCAFAAEKCDGIGFCFSYLMDSLPSGDARLKRLSKKVQIRGAEGSLIGAELKSALFRRGIDFNGNVTVLNDASALLLGGRALAGAKNGGFAGFILGTGVNSCYVERTKNMTPCGAYAEREMIINLESGAYSGIRQSAADEAVDRKSGTCGEKRLEKMVGGAYLADVFHEALCRAYADGLFAGRAPGRIDIAEVSAFCAEGAVKNTDDAERLRELFSLLFARTAKLCAVNIAAIATKCARDGAANVVIDGSTYYKNPLLRKYTEGYLSDFSTLTGLDLRLFCCDDAVLTGASFAG